MARVCLLYTYMYTFHYIPTNKEKKKIMKCIMVNKRNKNNYYLSFNEFLLIN